MQNNIKKVNGPEMEKKYGGCEKPIAKLNLTRPKICVGFSEGGSLGCIVGRPSAALYLDPLGFEGHGTRTYGEHADLLALNL